MTAVRTSSGSGRYGAAGEYDAVFRTLRTDGGTRPPLLYLHGANSSAMLNYGDASESKLMRTLAARYTVMCADLGGNVFGNDTGMTRVGQALDYLASAWGATGPAVLVGASMGACNALNFALRFPPRVAAVAGIIPGVDLGDIHTRNPMGTAPLLDSAYPPAYDDAVHGPDRSPVQFAAELDVDLPIRLWYSTDDPIVLPSTVTAFGAARPQTTMTSLGAVGHSSTSVGSAVDTVNDWLAGL